MSVYDTINKDAQYSLKVRRLGEYHPGLAATKDQEGQDIGDPLYGNAGGVDELVPYSHHICFDWAVHDVLVSCWCCIASKHAGWRLSLRLNKQETIAAVMHAC